MVVVINNAANKDKHKCQSKANYSDQTTFFDIKIHFYHPKTVLPKIWFLLVLKAYALLRTLQKAYLKAYDKNKSGRELSPDRLIAV